MSMSAEQNNVSGEPAAEGYLSNLATLHELLITQRVIGNLIERKHQGDPVWNEELEANEKKSQLLINLFKNAALYCNPLDLKLTFFPYPGEILFDESLIPFELTGFRPDNPYAKFTVRSDLGSIRKPHEVETSIEAHELMQRAFGENFVVEYEKERKAFDKRTLDEILRQQKLIEQYGDGDGKLQAEMTKLFTGRLLWKGFIQLPEGYSMTVIPMFEKDQPITPVNFNIRLMRGLNAATFEAFSRELLNMFQKRVFHIRRRLDD